MENYITAEKLLSSELEQILQNDSEMNVKAKKAAKLISNTLTSFRNKIRKEGFPSNDDEIYFFKKIKPRIQAYLIFFSILSEIETSKYHMCDEEMKNLIEKKLRMFRYIMRENLDFVTYMKEGLIHLDRQYFIRHSEIPKITKHSATMLMDPEFSTTYDVVAANIIAHQMFLNYLCPETEIQNKTLSYQSKLKWTASKSDFIELVYALQATTAINYGEIEIKEICTALQSIFQVNIEDPYRIFIDLCNRKTAPVKFIPKMEEGFLRKVNEADGMR